MFTVMVYSYVHLSYTHTWFCILSSIASLAVSVSELVMQTWTTEESEYEDSKVVNYKLRKRIGGWLCREPFQPCWCNEVIHICPMASAIKLQFALSKHIALQYQKWSIYVHCSICSFVPKLLELIRDYMGKVMTIPVLRTFCDLLSA